MMSNENRGCPILFGLIEKGGVSSEARPLFLSHSIQPLMMSNENRGCPILFGLIEKGGVSSEARPLLLSQASNRS